MYVELFIFKHISIQIVKKTSQQHIQSWRNLSMRTYVKSGLLINQRWAKQVSKNVLFDAKDCLFSKPLFSPRWFDYFFRTSGLQNSGNASNNKRFLLFAFWLLPFGTISFNFHRKLFWTVNLSLPFCSILTNSFR